MGKTPGLSKTDLGSCISPIILKVISRRIMSLLITKSIPDGVGRVMPWLFCRLLGFRVRLFRMRTHLLVLIPLFEQGRITMTVSDTPLE